MLIEIFNHLFSPGYFVPHGHCYLWKPGLVLLHTLSDSIISLAYYVISIILVYLIYQRKDLPFDWMFLMFGAFIIACGTTHALEILTLWHPIYWFSGLIKATTALVSIYTAASLIPLAPKILALPSTAQLEAANLSLQNEIVERKRVEAALRDSQQILQLVIDNIPQLIFWKDHNSNFFGCNQKMAQIAGLNSPEEIVGKSNNDLVWEKEFQVFFNNFHGEDLNKNTREAHGIERILYTDSSNIWLEVNKIPLNHSISNNLKILYTIEDVTEQKKAEDETRKAIEKEKEFIELKSRFITTISHDFRTPLTIILSSAEMLKVYLNKLSEEKIIKHLQRIENTVQNMAQLLDDILLLQKYEGQKIEFKPIQMEVVEFCVELVEEFKISTNKHHIYLNNQPLSIRGNLDPKILRQILSNLLSNAIKYSPQGGNIYVNLFKQRETVIFQVKDEGIGIPVTEQSQLFTSFYRATNVGNISGTGLGLSIVKKAVDCHQGQITVESEVGTGTTITVILPLNSSDGSNPHLVVVD